MDPNDTAPESPLVAIVDDDFSMRMSTQRLLRSFGFGAEAFASGREFLDSGRVEATACLILDVRMAGMDGLELQRHLAHAHSRIPIIFVTAHANSDEQGRALEAGAAAFLRKPVSSQALVNALRAALRPDDQPDHGP